MIGTITASELDTPIAFLRRDFVDDGISKVRGEPYELAQVWSNRHDVGDAEQVRAAAQGRNLTTRFGVRFDSVTSSITTADQITCDDATYEITGIKEWRGRRVGIEFTAVAI